MFIDDVTSFNVVFCSDDVTSFNVVFCSDDVTSFNVVFCSNDVTSFNVVFCSNQFKHKRMNEPSGNVEITNPIYTGDDDDDAGPYFGEDFDSDKVSTFELYTLSMLDWFWLI